MRYRLGSYICANKRFLIHIYLVIVTCISLIISLHALSHIFTHALPHIFTDTILTTHLPLTHPRALIHTFTLHPPSTHPHTLTHTFTLHPHHTPPTHTPSHSHPHIHPPSSPHTSHPHTLTLSPTHSPSILIRTNASSHSEDLGSPLAKLLIEKAVSDETMANFFYW